MKYFAVGILFTTNTIDFHCYYIIYSTEVSGFFILFFISYSKRINTLFTETSSSWLIYESNKNFEIRMLIVFNLCFPINTILSCVFFFFFIIDSYFLIPAVIAHMFIPTLDLVIPGISTNEANAEIETTSNWLKVE